ncbi:hypothetical protein DBV05_g3067 [Lasiodiplodia theobromae]|uniref:Uncharacterized protein n=1 Tax=Lasiodiplodia theobromae TaxID=45133 RepID=A0A5N5DL19_9PEZI|nr:hypothetical protein DBV05_g3067 [Lasiodiplodia theobromae]
MFRQILLSILTTSITPLGAEHFNHPQPLRQDDTSPAATTSAIAGPWSPCLRQNPGCQEIYYLIQRCWDTGVPGGQAPIPGLAGEQAVSGFDPNDRDISEAFRTCFCGDQRTTEDEAWTRCAFCVINAGMRRYYTNRENTDIVLFCSTPDPNLYLWLSAFLNFSLITAPDAWSSAPSPLLTGPITAITADAVKSRYKPDPSANMLPSDIIILTTATLNIDDWLQLGHVFWR